MKLMTLTNWAPGRPNVARESFPPSSSPAGMRLIALTIIADHPAMNTG